MGTVLDVETMKPVPGAHVVARWFGRSSNALQSSTRCLSFAGARTDAEGKFSLPDKTTSSLPFPGETTRGLTAYAPGYEYVGATVGKSTTVEMRPFKDEPRVRLLRISESPPLQCASVSQRSLLIPMFESMYEEAKAIAKAGREFEYRDAIWGNLLMLQLGEKEFKRRNESGELFK